MDRWVLSQQAADDLIAIYVYTHQEFGHRQAEAYTSDIEETFSTLAGNPALGRELTDIAGEYRYLVHAHHLIIYRSHGDEIFIVRVLHGRQDIARILRDEWLITKHQNARMDDIISAAEAKLNLDALIEKVQREPITIPKKMASLRSVAGDDRPEAQPPLRLPRIHRPVP